MQYPERISRFRKWAALKVASGKVGLGDKSASRGSFRHKKRRMKRRRRAKALIKRD